MTGVSVGESAKRSFHRLTTQRRSQWNAVPTGSSLHTNITHKGGVIGQSHNRCQCPTILGRSFAYGYPRTNYTFLETNFPLSPEVPKALLLSKQQKKSTLFLWKKFPLASLACLKRLKAVTNRATCFSAISMVELSLHSALQRLHDLDFTPLTLFR